MATAAANIAGSSERPALSPQAKAKGEEFVQVLLEEGRDYDFMKDALQGCAVMRSVSQTRGDVAAASRLLKVSKGTMWAIIRKFKLLPEVDAIKRLHGVPIGKLRPRFHREEK